MPAAQPRKPFSLNPWGEIAQGITRLFRDRNLWMTTVGITPVAINEQRGPGVRGSAARGSDDEAASTSRDDRMRSSSPSTARSKASTARPTPRMHP